MIVDQITLLNETTLECLNEIDEIKIVTAFTKVGLEVLGANFGFVWLNSSSFKKDLELVYKSPNLPYTPKKPKKDGRNYKVIGSANPDFVTKVKKRQDEYDVSRYMKSFVIIPLVYKKEKYGSMVFCFKKPESFSKEKRVLSSFIGNSVAQAITISRLIIDERKAIEKEKIAENNKILLEEEKNKIEFIANATHELRTPLAIIKGNVDLAIKQNKLSNQKDAFEAIDQEVMHLAEILSDLTLIISTKEQLKNKIVYDKISLKTLVADTIKRCVVLARKKGISISTKSMPNITITGNKIYLEKLLINLITNSITYGKNHGQTTINVKKEKNSLIISISDTGIGISREDLPHVFERFYRADKSHSTGGNSTGLGLAIVKWIAEIHGGEVGVKSIAGKGSIFSVSIPISHSK